MTKTQDIIELDLMQIVSAIWRRLWAVILAALLFGGASFAVTRYLITPQYRASALLYVNNSSFSLGSTDFSISSSELTATQSLVDTYIVILGTRSTLNEVIQQAELDYTYEELSEMISASAVNATEVFEVVATSPSPAEAERIANAIADVLPGKIADVVEGSSVRIVDYAVVPAERSSPSYAKNIILGVLLGVLVSAAVIILREMFDVFVRSEQYLTQTYTIPVLAVIPDMCSTGSENAYRGGSDSGQYTSRKGS